MKIKRLFIVMVLNTFLMLFTSVLYEYVSLSSRFQVLEDTINIALEQAINTSVKAEEMFEDASTIVDSNVSQGSKMLVWFNKDNCFKRVSPYAYSMFTDNLSTTVGNQPDNYVEKISSYTTFKDTVSSLCFGSEPDVIDVYKYLYGNVGITNTNGSWYSGKNLTTWQNRDIQNAAMDYSRYMTLYSRNYGDTTKVYDRTPTTEFQDFYNNIGSSLMTAGFLRNKSGSSYKLVVDRYPILLNMGLDLNQSCNTYFLDNHAPEGTATSQNFLEVLKTGKRSGSSSSLYMLTPNSLGVTYIPNKVLKSTFMANLDTIVRFNKLSGSNPSTTNEANNILSSASNCMDSSHSDYLSDKANQYHIVNDGDIEYSKDKCKMRVDYYIVNFYDPANYQIVTKCLGTKSYYNASGTPTNESVLKSVIEDLANHDNAKIDSTFKVFKTRYPYCPRDYIKNMAGQRVVARVSVLMNVHIPYKSPIVSYFSKHHDYSIYNHNDIFAAASSSETGDRLDAVKDTSGVPFYCVKYFVTSR